MLLRSTTRNRGRRTRSSAAARALRIRFLGVAFRCMILGKISQIYLPVKPDRQIPSGYRAIAAFAGFEICGGGICARLPRTRRVRFESDQMRVRSVDSNLKVGLVGYGEVGKILARALRE